MQLLKDVTHKLLHIVDCLAPETGDNDRAPGRSTMKRIESGLRVVRTIPRRYEHLGVLNQTIFKRPSDLRNAPKTNTVTVSSSLLSVRLYSIALQQDSPFERFDLFVPDKAAVNFPQIHFQNPAKCRSNKVLNMTERAWKNIAVYVPMNVSSLKHPILQCQ